MRYFLSRKEPKIDDSGEFSFESSDRGLVSFALGSLAIVVSSPRVMLRPGLHKGDDVQHSVELTNTQLRRRVPLLTGLAHRLLARRFPLRRAIAAWHRISLLLRDGVACNRQLDAQREFVGRA
jgi:hypothetical protein